MNTSLPAVMKRSLPRKRLRAMALLLSVLPAHAMPPPPPEPPLLRHAGMTVTVKLIQARNGTVFSITELCKISGKIPVYADEGIAASIHAREIGGCRMSRNRQHLRVSVLGAKAMTKKGDTYATAYVGVVAPDAIKLCSMCGLQPLADSRAEVRVSGRPKSLSFSLDPNPVSMLNTKPTLWLEADVEMVD